MLDAERAEVARRRKVVRWQGETGEPQVIRRGDSAGGSRPDDVDELVGLALSGGGIRSATIGLGVMQALDRLGILKSIDYISTVSGGGFTGSAVSAWFGRVASGEEEVEGSAAGGLFPFRAADEAGESALERLRDNSDYLAPEGALGPFVRPAHVIRGFLFNLLLLLPWLTLAAFVTEIVFESVRGVLGELIYVWVPLVTVAIFLLCVLGYTLSTRRPSRRFWQRAMAGALFGVAVALLLVLLRLAMGAAFDLADLLLRLENIWADSIDWFTDDGGWKPVLGTLVVLGILAAVPLPAWLAKLRSTAKLVVAGLFVPTVLFLIYIALCVWSGIDIYSEVPLVFDPPQEITEETSLRFVEGEGWTLEGPGGTRKIEKCDDGTFRLMPGGAVAVPPPRDGRGGRGGRGTRPSGPVEFVRVQTAAPGEEPEPFRDVAVSSPESDAAGEEAAELGDEAVAEPEQEIADESAGADETAPPEEAPCVPDTDDRFELDGDKVNLVDQVTGGPGPIDGLQRTELVGLGIFAAILAALYILMRLKGIDANLLSWHGFYRDRIGQAFDLRDHKLSDLDTVGAGGPYPLINTALNAPAAKGPDPDDPDAEESPLARRKVGFFFFSPLFVGGEDTGYCRTEQMERLAPNLQLSSATAISAAAASPIMGDYTLWPLVFSFTMLNIRLNFWAPNPDRSARGQAKKPPLANPMCLVREATGLVHAEGDQVLLSDGGHIENLGVYELLRRRCKVIVAVDGEEDGELGFGSLGALVRFAQIDMRTTIEIDPAPIGRDKDWSGAHWVLGEIHYPDAEKGYLIYLKASLTDDEGPGVLAYARGTAFPHESTADQAFTEKQFEAYRALGEHIGAAALSELKDEPKAAEAHSLLTGRSGRRSTDPPRGWDEVER